MAKDKEFGVEAADGTMDDASMHAPILDNASAEQSVLKLTRKRLLDAGEDPAVIDELYPLD